MSETVHGVSVFLDQFAPLSTAESWDNVGLLLGDCSRKIDSIMTCLTLTPDVATEAIEKNIGLIVTHHPVMFQAVQKLTTETSQGRMLLELAENRIAVYSPHTAFDSAARGINQQWCELLDLKQIQPLRPFVEQEDEAESSPGAGRCGDLQKPVSLNQLIQQVKKVCSLEHLQYVGNPEAQIRRVGVACGSAAEFMEEASQLDCDVLITGEARFHALLEARTKPIAMIIVGHYASERFACERLAEFLQAEFSNLATHASSVESDPVSFG